MGGASGMPRGSTILTEQSEHARREYNRRVSATLGSVRMEETKVIVIPTMLDKDDNWIKPEKIIKTNMLKAQEAPPATCIKERAKQTRREFTPKPVKDNSAILGAVSKVCWTIVVLTTVGYVIWEMIKWRAM